MGFENRDYYRDDGSNFRMRYGFTPPSPVCMWIMIVCVVVFALQNLIIVNQTSPATDWLELTMADGKWWMQLWRWVTYQYCHAGSMHIFFNLIGIYFFYPALEAVWGRRTSFLFYTAGGIAAGLVFALISVFTGRAPSLVGASGSILALLGACAVLFPERQILLFFFPVPIRLVAVLLGLLYALSIIGERNLSNAAHLGGLGFGIAVAYYGNRVLIDLPATIAKTRRAREEAAAVNHEAEVDRILAKVSAQGMHTLTRSEQNTLKQASARRRH